VKQPGVRLPKAIGAVAIALAGLHTRSAQREAFCNALHRQPCFVILVIKQAKPDGSGCRRMDSETHTALFKGYSEEVTAICGTHAILPGMTL
jgi:hypothetical protein